MDEFIHNGLHIEYEVEGEGIPLVFLHGMGGDSNQIHSVYEPIEGVSLITMNQQGHGKSDVQWDKYDFNHLGDDVLALLDQLNIDQAYFAGISMGAAVCLNIAVRYPGRVKKLLLIRNAWTDSPMSQEVWRAYYDLGMALQVDKIEEFYKTKGWEIVSKASDYTKKAFTSTFENSSCKKNWKKYTILPSKTPIGSLDELEKLTMPVIILANRNDLCHPFEYGQYMCSHIKKSECIEIPDKDSDPAGHKAGVNNGIRKMLDF